MCFSVSVISKLWMLINPRNFMENAWLILRLKQNNYKKTTMYFVSPVFEIKHYANFYKYCNYVICAEFIWTICYVDNYLMNKSRSFILHIFVLANVIKAWGLVLINWCYNCIHIFYTCIQRRIQNPVEHLRRSFFTKIVNGF